MLPTVLWIRATPTRTQIELHIGPKMLLSGELPAPRKVQDFRALRRLIHAFSTWLEVHLEVALHVSAEAYSWWGQLGERTGLPLGGTSYDCTVFVEENESEPWSCGGHS